MTDWYWQNNEDLDQTAPSLFVILQRKPKCSILGYFQYLFQVFQSLEVSTWKMVVEPLSAEPDYSGQLQLE